MKERTVGGALRKRLPFYRKIQAAKGISARKKRREGPRKTIEDEKRPCSLFRAKQSKAGLVDRSEALVTALKV